MKEIFILKKEHVFPNFWKFKDSNDKIWKKKLKFISKFVKKKKILLICDNEHHLYFKNQGIRCRVFGDYLEEYENIYKEAVGYSKQILNAFCSKEEGYLIEEDLAYILINYLDNINILDKISKKEHPDRVYCIDSFFGEFVKLIFKRKVRKIRGFNFSQKISTKIKNNFSFKARFNDLPMINRIEFVKTKTRKPEQMTKNKKRILVLGFDDLYYGRISNFVKDILNQKQEEVFILCTNRDMQQKLKAQGLNFISFGDYLKKDYLNDVTKVSKESRKKLRKRRNFASLFNYRGYNFSNLFRGDLSHFLVYRLPWAILYYKCYKHLYKKAEIDYVIAIDDRIAESRAGFMAARNSGIKNIIVQSGVAEDNAGRGFIPLTADKISVWGEDVKKYLLDFGVSPDRVEVTGSLRLEKPEVKLSKTQVYDKLEIKNDNPLIIIAAQMFGGDFGESEKELFLRECIIAAKEIPDKNFIIKLHPRETPDIHQALLKELTPKNVKIAKEPNINELINHSEGLITIFSTAIIEAMLLGKNSISLNLAGRPDVVPFSKHNSVIYIKDKQSLKSNILLLKDKNLLKGQKKFLKNYCYKIDNQASKRLLKIIRK